MLQDTQRRSTGKSGEQDKGQQKKRLQKRINLKPRDETK